jgi:hypothetical protein
MARGWVVLLCAALLLWRPVGFIPELLQSLPSLGMRGVPGAIELVFHGIVAAVAVAAAQALWDGKASAPILAAVALVGSAGAAVQSLYWTALPSDTVPGTERLIAAVAIGHAALWLIYLTRSQRIRKMSRP